ncbi:VOC family protein [Mumia quercus]|uniref:VOC family protein n=1 Tax=Mumia quercus TaxID=2976125 RepID=UPI0021D0CAD0|nr:VOC family protein [Mumia quercus]
MLRGLATLTLFADDLPAARDWYAEVLGVAPYYAFPSAEAPGYVEFRLGDHQHELGIIDARYAPPGQTRGPAGVVAYWHVDDLEGARDHLLAHGATAHLPITEQGDGSGFITASVVDPFGNILGIMNNPHYLEMLEQMTGASARA